MLLMQLAIVDPAAQSEILLTHHLIFPQIKSFLKRKRNFAKQIESNGL